MAVTNKFAGFDVTGLDGGWYITVWHSETDDIATARQVQDQPLRADGSSPKPPAYIRIRTNGIINFGWFPGSGYLWAKLEGGRTAVTVNMDVLFGS